MSGDDKGISIELVMRLFDIAKNSADKNADEIKDLTIVIGELAKSSGSPSHQQLLDKLENNINRGTKFITDKSEESERLISSYINNIGINVEKLCKLVRTMILVVVLSFTLMTVSYVFVQNSVSTIIDREVKKISDTYEQREDILKKLIDKGYLNKEFFENE